MQSTSVRNAYLREIRKAAAAGRCTPDGLVVAEGPHLISEARNSAWTIEQMFCSPDALTRFAGLLADYSGPITAVSQRALQSMADTETTQGILALLRPRRWTWADVLGNCPLLVVLDAIRDPGNLGTIARSAEAFGASGLLLAPETVRIFNGKALRAAAGSLFRLPFLEFQTREEILHRLALGGLKNYALTGHGPIPLTEADLASPCALFVGNEGAGLSLEFLTNAEGVAIQTCRVDSLNAAVACSVALFEAARQRKRP